MSNDTVHVIGAGLGGLTAAALVARTGTPVVIHDARARIGGRAVSDDQEGFRFNLGPHALYDGGHALTVLADLGIQIPWSAPSIAGVGVAGDVQSALPGTPGSLVRTKLLGLRGKANFARLFATLGRLDPTRHATTSASDWIADVAPDQAAANLLHAFVRLGTYADLPDQMSADVAIRLLQLGTTRKVAYVHGGWQTIVDGLRRRLETMDVTFADPGPVDTLPDGAATIVAVGSAQAAGAIVGHRWDVGPAAEATCLDLGLRGRPPVDFALGIDAHTYLSNHSIADGFAPTGASHVAVAGYLRPGHEPRRDRLEDFARRIGIADDDVVTARYLHRMVVTTSIPTAARGGEAGRPGVVVPDQPGVFVVGDWVGPDGHLADASFASARAAASAAVRHLASRPVAR